MPGSGTRLVMRNLYSVSRAVEAASFLFELQNKQTLFHGSRAQNWLGILSHGLVPPKVGVTSRFEERQRDLDLRCRL